jgi:hypothetical protein
VWIRDVGDVRRAVVADEWMILRTALRMSALLAVRLDLVHPGDAMLLLRHARVLRG